MFSRTFEEIEEELWNEEMRKISRSNKEEIGGYVDYQSDLCSTTYVSLIILSNTFL